MSKAENKLAEELARQIRDVTMTKNYVAWPTLEPLIAILEPHLVGEGEVCNWTITPDPDCEFWETDCGEAFQFETGGPKENKMRFCSYCGKLLNEVIAVLKLAAEAHDAAPPKGEQSA